MLLIPVLIANRLVLHCDDCVGHVGVAGHSGRVMFLSQASEAVFTSEYVVFWEVITSLTFWSLGIVACAAVEEIAPFPIAMTLSPFGTSLEIWTWTLLNVDEVAKIWFIDADDGPLFKPLTKDDVRESVMFLTAYL